MGVVYPYATPRFLVNEVKTNNLYYEKQKSINAANELEGTLAIVCHGRREHCFVWSNHGNDWYGDRYADHGAHLFVLWLFVFSNPLHGG